MSRGAATKRPGRNQPCPCGSGKKVKWCCGETAGPGPEDLARAELRGLARVAARQLRHLSDEQFDELLEELVDLPALDLSLLWPLPRLFPPELERLLAAIDDEDAEEMSASMPAVLTALDTQQGRLRLARAVLAVADDDCLEADVAATAVVDLASPSAELVRASIVEALLVSTGAEPTPSGLIVVTR